METSCNSLLQSENRYKIAVCIHRYRQARFNVLALPWKSCHVYWAAFMIQRSLRLA